MISLAAVNITEKTRLLVDRILREGAIGQSHFITEFENAIKKYVGSSHAVAVASGTMADTIALAALKNLRPEKNEVIVPALTFIAHVNASYYNHLTPVFVDVRPDLQIDPEQIESKITKKTLAIMPADLLGNLAPMDEVVTIAKKHNLFVVTDSCEAFGARYRNRFSGTIADCGTYSFFPSHTITCGEGGMIVTGSEKIAALARRLRNHGRLGDSIGDKFVFPTIGFNGKLNTLEAVMGLGLIDNIENYVEARHKAYEFFIQAFEIDILGNSDRKYIVPHGFPLLFPDSKIRDRALEAIFQQGVECRKFFRSIPTQEESYRFLGYKPGMFPVAEDLAGRGLYLPSHQNLTRENLDYIVKVVKPLLA